MRNEYSHSLSTRLLAALALVIYRENLLTMTGTGSAMTSTPLSEQTPPNTFPGSTRFGFELTNILQRKQFSFYIRTIYYPEIVQISL